MPRDRGDRTRWLANEFHPSQRLERSKCLHGIVAKGASRLPTPFARCLFKATSQSIFGVFDCCAAPSASIWNISWLLAGMRISGAVCLTDSATFHLQSFQVPFETCTRLSSVHRPGDALPMCRRDPIGTHNCIRPDLLPGNAAWKMGSLMFTDADDIAFRIKVTRERRRKLGPRVVTVVKRRLLRDSYLISLNETAITFKF